MESRFGAIDERPSGVLTSRRRLELQSELELLEKFTVMAKTKINQSQPVSRLPCEVLGDIFTYVHDAWPSTTRGPGWLTVGMVSHSWREVRALAHKST